MYVVIVTPDTRWIIELKYGASSSDICQTTKLWYGLIVANATVKGLYENQAGEISTVANGPSLLNQA